MGDLDYYHTSKHLFTAKEMALAVAILNKLNPDLFWEDDVRSLIYKAKAVQKGDFIKIVESI